MGSRVRVPYAPHIHYGTLTEWLGSGLQNRVQQFESAGYLFSAAILELRHFFCLIVAQFFWGGGRFYSIFKTVFGNVSMFCEIFDEKSDLVIAATGVMPFR